MCVTLTVLLVCVMCVTVLLVCDVSDGVVDGVCVCDPDGVVAGVSLSVVE